MLKGDKYIKIKREAGKGWVAILNRVVIRFKITYQKQQLRKVEIEKNRAWKRDGKGSDYNLKLSAHQNQTYSCQYDFHKATSHHNFHCICQKVDSQILLQFLFLFLSHPFFISPFSFFFLPSLFLLPIFHFLETEKIRSHGACPQET